jgi:hypothetical protein
MIQLSEKSSPKEKNMKFFRRKDITTQDRAMIGLKAIVGAGVYGTVISLASTFNVSRPFVYELRDTALTAFQPSQCNDEKEIEASLVNKIIIVMRLCCKSSIGGISEALKLLGYKNNSVGYVSQFLKDRANLLIDDLPICTKPITVLADEIFICGRPVLIILDAISHLILAIELADNRTGDTWEACFASLICKGYRIEKVAKDLGSGLSKGVEKLGVIEQADIFHLLMKFDPYIGSLEKQAEGAIESEENSLRVLNNRKSESAILKSMDKLFNEQDSTTLKVQKYDDYDYLHKEMHIAFNTFNKDGSFRDESEFTGDISAILELMEEAFKEHSGIMKAVKFLRKNLNGYLPYIKQVKAVLEEAQKIIPDYIITEICLSYQKSLKGIAIKDYRNAKKMTKEADEHRELALLMTRNENEVIATQNLVNNLSRCVRSSSALEAKNSVIRKYTNSMGGQVSQRHLNLIAFYLNRKVSVRGKYKGFSPLERSANIKEELSFLEILLQSDNK